MKARIKDMIKFIKRMPIRKIALIASPIFFILLTVLGHILIGFILFILLNCVWLIPYIKRNIQKNTKPRVSKIEEKENLESEENMRKKGNKPKKKKGKIILLVILCIFLAIMVAGIAFLTYIVITAPKFDPDNLYTKEASTLYDSNGESFARLGSEMREKIGYEDMSEELVNAIVATEDSRFFQHNGFDLPRFMKASFGQLLGQNAGGASTLTMQVSKNQFTSTTSSGFEGIKRKFTDIYLSIFQIERNYTKEEILEFYANSNYLGSGAYGVEQAAETYFGKSAKELNLSEAAMIAGMFQSPVAYDPNINPDQTEERRQLVLKLMKRHGYINNEEYKIAKKMSVDRIVIKGQSAHNSYEDYQGFIDTVAVEVEEKTGYDPYSYSMKIYTTMDREKQDKITKIMTGETYSWENDKVDAGIVALDNNNGEILAVGAGRNSSGAKSFNNATMMKKQIGSTAKPLFDYGPAIEYNDWNTYHPIIDSEYTYSDGTEINNYDGRYKGIMTIREALVDSRNIPALKTFQSVKNSQIKEFVEGLGLSPEVASNGKLHEAHAIGGYTGESPLTVAGAYAAFANEGEYIEPHSFTKVVFDADGSTYENEIEKNQVMSEDTAYMVYDMLIDTGKNALGRYNNINGAEFGAKTGTTNYDEDTMKKYHLPSSAVNDLWVAGINKDYSIAVWYGYDNINEGHNYFGSSQNSRLFQTVAKDYFKADAKIERPDSIVETTVERYCATPLLPSENTPSNMKTKELFKKNSEPTEVSARYTTLSDVTNVKASVSGNKATITWKGINTPQALSSNYWKPFVEKAFNVTSDQNTYLNYIMGVNNTQLGNLVYKVYLKTGGSERLLTTTSSTSATVNLTTDSPTFVVKAGYSNYGGSDSKGVETKVSYDKADASDIEVTLVGEDTVNITAGQSYSDENPPIKATLDGEDITNEVKYTSAITDATGNPVNFPTTSWTAGQYTITYTVTYEGVTVNTLERTIIVS